MDFILRCIKASYSKPSFNESKLLLSNYIVSVRKEHKLIKNKSIHGQNRLKSVNKFVSLA